MTLLDVRGLHTAFDVGGGLRPIVDGVSFSLGEGEVLGLVGESGSGKSVTASSLVRLLGHNGRITGGQVNWRGRAYSLDAEARLAS